MWKIIKEGQIVRVGNILYRSEKCSDVLKTCNKCDLYKQCHRADFTCDMLTYFKRVRTIPTPKTRRCKKLQNNSL